MFQTIEDRFGKLNIIAEDLGHITDSVKDLLKKTGYPGMKILEFALSSVADSCIIPIQDYLGLGEEARMNEPSTVAINWRWRLQEGEITEDLISKIKYMTKLYGRI